jgi:hypothetical protein
MAMRGVLGLQGSEGIRGVDDQPPEAAAFRAVETGVAGRGIAAFHQIAPALAPYGILAPGVNPGGTDGLCSGRNALHGGAPDA